MLIRLANITSLAALLTSSFLSAQSPQPMGQLHPSAQPLDNVVGIAAPAIDRVAIEAEDDLRHQQGLPARYAMPHPVDIDTLTGGTWEVLDAAWSLWRLRIKAPGSDHVNVGFDRFKLPPTGRMMYYSADYQNVLRPFDDDDHAPDGQLWTPVVNGDDMVVEVYVQTIERPAVDLHLIHVGSGYRFFGAGAHAVSDGGSGSCNVDVNCSQGASWVNEIPSVAAISSGGSIFCTGFMVNNTAQDSTPYFMTANHCGVHNNAGSLVCYWNYERAVCGSGTGPLTQFTTGSQLRATYSTSDFTLVQLNSQPNPNWGVTYAGWSWSSTPASSAVAIHHPSGDDKKISFENQATQITSYGGTSSPGNNTHVRVVDWDVGTTEPGSSGSPLFDQNHRVIGQLHGGGAACGNNQSDWYGWFARSWTGGGSSSNHLSSWLDPLGTGQQTLDTLGSNAATAAPFGSGCGVPTAATVGQTFYELFGSFDLANSALRFVPQAGGQWQVLPCNACFYNSYSNNLGLGDDQLSRNHLLGFAFPLPGGGSTTSIDIDSNGWVGLQTGAHGGSDYTETTGEFLANPRRIAPCWDDLNPSSAGGVYFDTIAGKAIVTWAGVPEFPSSGSNTFQLQLLPSGEFVLLYQSMSVGDCLVGHSVGSGAADPGGSDLSNPATTSNLTHSINGTPAFGAVRTLTTTNLPAGTAAGVHVLGLSSFPLGIDLTSQGLTGCSQYVPFTSVKLVLPFGSQLTSTLQVPNNTGFLGLPLNAQAYAFASGVNPAGVLSSNGIGMVVGN